MKKNKENKLEVFKFTAEQLSELDDFTQHMEKVIAIMPDHFYWCDRNGVYLGCNDIQIKDSKLTSKDQIIGKKIEDFLNFDAYNDTFFEMIYANNQIVINSGETHSFEESNTLSNGDEKIFLSKKSPIKDKNGIVIGIFGISYDITDQKKLEKNLKKSVRNSEIALENIIANLPGHVYWQDEKGVIMGCNDSQAKSAGFELRKDLIGKTAYDLPWKSQAPILDSINTEVMNKKITYIVEEPSTLANGKEATFLSHKSPLINSDGDAVGVLGISFDITDRKKAENELKETKLALLRANKAKSHFMDSINSEIREFLNHIEGSQYELDKYSTNKEIFTLLQTIKKGTINIVSILDNIQTYLNLEIEDNTLRNEKIDLALLIQELCLKNKDLFSQKNIENIVEIDEKVPEFVTIDAFKLHRALDIVINNAFLHATSSSVYIKVKVHNERLVIFIENQGHPIPEDKLKVIFNFFSNKFSKENILEKSGIKLSIVKKIIDILGGTIEIKNSKDASINVEINLPLIIDSTASEEISHWKSFKSKNKILVIEDDGLKGNALLNFFGEYENQLSDKLNSLKLIKKLSNQKLKPFSLIIFNYYTAEDINLINTIQLNIEPNETILLILVEDSHDDLIEEIKNNQIALGKNNIYILNKPIYPKNLKDFLTKTWDSRFKIKIKALVVDDDCISLRVQSQKLKDLGCEVTSIESGELALEHLIACYDIIFLDMHLGTISGIDIAKKYFQQMKRNKKIIPIVAVTSQISDKDKAEIYEAGISGVIAKPAKIDNFETFLNELILR